MSNYKHGAYAKESASSLVPPTRVEVSMPVIVSTAPVHTLEDGKPAPVNKPILIFTAAEAMAQLGTLPEGASSADYPLLQAVDIYLKRYLMAPICVINVFDPVRHVDAEGQPDVSKVTAADIIGGIDSVTGARFGLELLDEIYPRLGIIPGQLIAPGFSHDPAVALVMGAKVASISGHFSCTAIVDIPETVADYTQAGAWVKDNNLTDKNLIMFFGSPIFNGQTEFGSIHWAGITAQRDSENSNIPYWSASNKRMLASGMTHAGEELFLDAQQAAYLNGQGIVTAISWIGGLVAWGNRTAAYPGITDVKDTFIPLRRMVHFVGNTLITTAWQFVDGPLNRRLAGTVCDTFNVWLNGLVRREFLLGGRVEFLGTENPVTDIMDGISRFNVSFTPASPARELNFILEYDPTYVSTTFGSEE